MPRLGTAQLGENRLGEEVWGDTTEGGQSVEWRAEVDLAPPEDWPLVINMEIVLQFIDPENVEGYNFTIDGECEADVDWTVKEVNNQTGEVVIDVDVEIDCPEDKTSWTGDLRGDFQYDGPTGVNGTTVEPETRYIDSPDDDDPPYERTPHVNEGYNKEYPGFGYYTNPSVVSIGDSCTPSGHTATVPVTFNDLNPVKEYQIVVEWDPTKLEYTGYQGTPPDYTDLNDSQANYFEDATINASEGRLVMTATDDDTIQPYEPRHIAGVYDSGYLGSLKFNVLGEQGDVADLAIKPSETEYYDEEERPLGPENYRHGRIHIENGLHVGNDTARPDHQLTVPVEIQAGQDVAAYNITLEIPYDIVDFSHATGRDLPDPATEVDTVTKDVSGEEQSPNYRTFYRLSLSASQDRGVFDPTLCDLTFDALIAYFSAGEEGTINLVSADVTAPDGSDIPITCDTPGDLVITNPPGAKTDEIPCSAIDVYPITVTRTFVVEDLKNEDLRDIKVVVDSDTNPTEVERNWVQIPYSLNSDAAAVNATITVTDPDGDQECPADLTTYLQFFWEDGSVTASGLYAGKGVHAGGVKGLFSGSSLLTTGNTRGNFGEGFQF